MSERAPPDARFVVAPTARFAVLSIANGAPAGPAKGGAAKKGAAAPNAPKGKTSPRTKEAAAGGERRAVLCVPVDALP
jgi:hypothetical protein